MREFMGPQTLVRRLDPLDNILVLWVCSEDICLLFPPWKLAVNKGEQFISLILNTLQVALLLVTLSHFQIISCVSKRKHHGRHAKMWHVADSEESCGQYYSIHDSSVRKPSTLCNLPQVLLVTNHIFSIFILDQEHQQILCVSYHR